MDNAGGTGNAANTAEPFTAPHADFYITTAPSLGGGLEIIVGWLETPGVSPSGASILCGAEPVVVYLLLKGNQEKVDGQDIRNFLQKVLWAFFSDTTKAMAAGELKEFEQFLGAKVLEASKKPRTFMIWGETQPCIAFTKKESVATMQEYGEYTKTSMAETKMGAGAKGNPNAGPVPVRGGKNPPGQLLK